jgi:hypothetical protein
VRAPSQIVLSLIAVSSLVIQDKLASSELSHFGREFEIAGAVSAAWLCVHKSQLIFNGLLQGVCI